MVVIEALTAAKERKARKRIVRQSQRQFPPVTAYRIAVWTAGTDFDECCRQAATRRKFEPDAALHVDNDPKRASTFLIEDALLRSLDYGTVVNRSVCRRRSASPRPSVKANQLA